MSRRARPPRRRAPAPPGARPSRWPGGRRCWRCTWRWCPPFPPTEIAVGALAAAACAAAAVAARRDMLSAGADRPSGAARGPADGRVTPALLMPPLARLPAQVVSDTARVTLRGASGGRWTPLAVAPGPAARGAATLLVSASPGSYVGGVDPDRGLLRVHRLAGPTPFERSLRRAGLVDDPDPGGAGAASPRGDGPDEAGPREGGPS
ncbi:hypothetical protein AB0C21_39630 [Spirillospora sp. NPDC049024]